MAQYVYGKNVVKRLLEDKNQFIDMHEICIKLKSMNYIYPIMMIQ